MGNWASMQSGFGLRWATTAGLPVGETTSSVALETGTELSFCDYYSNRKDNERETLWERSYEDRRGHRSYGRETSRYDRERREPRNFHSSVSLIVAEHCSLSSNSIQNHRRWRDTYQAGDRDGAGGHTLYPVQSRTQSGTFNQYDYKNVSSSFSIIVILKFDRRTSKRNSISQRSPKICRKNLVLTRKIATRKTTKLRNQCHILPTRFKRSLHMGFASTTRKDLMKMSNTTTRTTMLFLCNKLQLVFRTIRWICSRYIFKRLSWP